MILSNNITTIILVISLIIVLYLIFLLIIVIYVEKSRFDRRIEPKNYIKEQDYTKYNGLIREEFSFCSNKNQLKGYIFHYGKTNNKKIIFSNGFNTTTESYIPEINYFASLGYTVYCYDNTGTGKSEGLSLRGTPQSLIDLHSCINYLKKESDEKIILVGHSMGAHAAVNVLNFTNVDKVIAISPYDNISDVVNDHIYSKFRKNIFLFKLIHKFYLRMKFKEYAKFKTFETLKYANTKVLVIHGEEDRTVKVDSCINASMFNTNMLVKYLILENKAHRPLLSQNSINYNLFLKHQLEELRMNFGKNIPEKQIQLLNKDINYKLKNELDNDVLEVIKSFLQEV